MRHFQEPPVVVSNGRNDVAVVLFDESGKEVCTPVDVKGLDIIT